MAVTISQIITSVDGHTGDITTDRITNSNRYDAITEAVVWLQGTHQSELQNFTYTLPFLDTLNYYNVTTLLSDLLMASDMRKVEGENHQTFAFRDGKEISRLISNGSTEDSYTIERVNQKAYIGINHTSKYPALIVSSFETLTDGGGTWSADTTNSDAVSLAVDSSVFAQGNASLSFNVTVAQSGNNRATISNSTLTSRDYTSISGISSGLLWVYMPTVTYVSSVTLYWGSSPSAYWSVSSTTPASGDAFIVGWNLIKFDWTASTTMTGTPTVTAITYSRIDVNYTGSMTDTTGFRVDYLRFARPENLTFYYLSSNVGKNNVGTAISLFSSSTDTPYYSGQYDQLKYATSHYAAGVLLQDVRLYNEANQQFAMAQERLNELKDILPSSRQRQTKSFKPIGISFNKRK